MVDEKVYYIKLQGYHSYIPFQHYVHRFLNSALYRTTFEHLKPITGSVSSEMTPQVKKQIIAIELQNLLVKRANQLQYDARKYHNKMNPREIDEIISRYILHHLRQFFKDGPPALSSNMRKLAPASGYRASNRTMKKKSRQQQQQQRSIRNIFYVDKASAIKNMRSRTMKNR